MSGSPNDLIILSDPPQALDVERARIGRRLAIATGALGVVSGWSLFFLWWEQSTERSPVTTLFIALGTAALAAAIFETILSRIEEPEAHWSLRRFGVTALLCFTAEIIANGAETLTRARFTAPSAVTHQVFGAVLPTGLGNGANTAALIGFWVVMGVVIGWRLARYVAAHPRLAFPVPDEQATPNERWRRLARAGLANSWRTAAVAALAGGLASIGYVLTMRAIVTIVTSIDSPASLGPIVDQALQATKGTAFHWAAAALLFPIRVVAGLGASLIQGLVIAALVLSSAAAWIKRVVALWVLVPLVILLAAPASVPPEALGRLGLMAAYTGIVWGIAGLVLGFVTPLLSGSARHPRVWGVVGYVVAGLLIVATLLRARHGPAALEWGALEIMIVTVVLLFGLLFTFGVVRPADVLPVVAFYVAIGEAGISTILSEAGLYRIQHEAWQLIELPRFAKANVAGSSEHPLFTIGRFEPLTWPARECLEPPGGTRFVSELFLDPATRVARQRERARLRTSATRSRLGESRDSLRTLISLGDWLPLRADTLVRAAGTIDSSRRPLAERRDTLDATVRRLTSLGDLATNGKAGRRGLDSMLQKESGCLESLSLESSELSDSVHSTQTEIAALRTAIGSELDPRWARAERAIASADTIVSTKLSRVREAAAQQLELTVVGSLGFWLTLGLLAAWRTIAPSPSES